MTAPGAARGGGETGWSAIWREGLLARFALVILGVWLNAADTLVTVTVMPSVAREIGGYAYFGWATGAFLLGAIVMGAASGPLAGRYGLRASTALAAAAYSAGCAAGALAPGIATFLLGRLLQGLGAGAIVGLTFVAVGAVFPERLWARTFSAMTAVWGVATVLGPLVGGGFAGLGPGAWRGAFLAFAAQGGIFLAAALALLPRGAGDADRLQPLPVRQLALVALGAVALAGAGLFAAPLEAAGAALGGLILLGLGVRLDGRSPARILPDDARRISRPAGAGLLAIFLLEAASVAWSIYGAAFLQVQNRITPLVSGYVVSAVALGWTGCAFLVAAAPERRQGLLIRTGPLVTLGGLGVIAASAARPGLLGPAGGSFLVGAGFGVCWSFLNRRILASLPEAERALGSAAVPTTQMVGGAFGAAAASALADLLGLGRSLDPATAAAAAPWLFGAFLPAAAAAAALAARVAADGGGDPRPRRGF